MVGLSYHALGGARISPREGAVLWVVRGHAQICPRSIFSKVFYSPGGSSDAVFSCQCQYCSKLFGIITLSAMPTLNSFVNHKLRN